MNTYDIAGRNKLALPFGSKPAGGQVADDKEFTARLPVIKRFPPAIRGHAVAVLGEGVGTFLFLFFAYAATLNANTTNDQIVSKNLYISLGFGFSLMVNAWTFFRVSGGLFNPAVTWGMCLVGAISWIRGALLFFTQLVAAIIAAAMARALFPADLNVQTTLAEGTSLAQGFFIEMFLTLQLVLTIFLLAAEKHRATFIAPVGIGLALFLAELAGVRYTGGSLNPARTLGPCIVNRHFYSYHWIYWIGPLLGASIAAIIYKLIKMLEYETANPEVDGYADRQQAAATVETLEKRASGSRGNGSRSFSAVNGFPNGDLYPGSSPIHNMSSNDTFTASTEMENGTAYHTGTTSIRS